LPTKTLLSIFIKAPTPAPCRKYALKKQKKCRN
jgi:hypothetical protein